MCRIKTKRSQIIDLQQLLQTVRLEAYVRIEKNIIPNAISFRLNVPIEARL
jgi:hypothetical protein